MLEKHFLVSNLSHDFTAERESPAVLDGEQRLCFLFQCVVGVFSTQALLQSSEIRMSASLNSPRRARPPVSNWE